MDAAALNAAAVQAATEAMLAAGFGNWEEVDEDAQQAQQQQVGGIGHQFHLAAQHTATAASSLSALPSSAFFSALRVGEGVDALDLIGHPQWRHAIILDSRHDEQEFFIRWAGWDSKWDEWVHCLRLAPAHSKVVGDTGPEDIPEKQLVSVLGNEWYHFLKSNPKLLSDVHLKIEGVAPWILMQQKKEALKNTTESTSTIESDDYKQVSTPPRHFASATPPSYASLDPDDDENGQHANDGFSLSLTPNAFRGTSRQLSSTGGAIPTSSTTGPSSISASPSTHSRPLPNLTLYGHENFLRIRCPRLFKYSRDPASESHPLVYEEKTNELTASSSKSKSTSQPLFTPSPKLSKSKSSTSGGPTSASAAPSSSRMTANATVPSAFSTPPPPSARLAKSASIGVLQKQQPSSGSQTARTSLTRQVSAVSISGSTNSPQPLSGSKTARKSVGSPSVISTPKSTKPSHIRAGSASTPGSPPPLSHSTSQPGSAVTPTTAAKPRRSLTNATATTPVTSTTTTSSRAGVSSASRSRTPNVSAPVTPKIKPVTSPATTTSTATPAGSPPATPNRSGSAAKSKFANVKSKLNTGRSATLTSSSKTSSPVKKPASSSTVTSPSDFSLSPPAPVVNQESLSSSGSSSNPNTDHEDNGAPIIDSSEISLMSSSSAPNTLAAPSSSLFPPPSSPLVSASLDSSTPNFSQSQPLPSSSQNQNESSNSMTVKEECKEQTSPPMTHTPATPAVAPVTPPKPTHKLLVLPLSSTKALHAFFEYLYTDNIIHSAVGERNHYEKKPSSSLSKSSRRYRDEWSTEADWNDSDEDTISSHTTNSSSTSSTTPSSHSSGALGVLDLFELACLGSCLHDPRLVCLAALHIQRTLNTTNIMSCLQVLDIIGALEHKQEREKFPITTLSVHLNGCLSHPKPVHATHPIQTGNKSARASPDVERSAAATNGNTNDIAIPASYLVPDTPATFLHSGLNLCGPSTHDFDLITRLVLDFLALQWNVIFGGGDGANMKLLHSFPFSVFQLVVNLRNGSINATSNGGAGSDGEASGGNHHVFKSPEEKAIYNQAQINAALIAAGISPTPNHNLFIHAASVSGLPQTSTSYQELLTLIASPSIALPPCNLLKVFKKMYDQPRNAQTCDVRILIEDDSPPVDNDSKSTLVKSSRPIVKATVWAHKIVLACGSEFFRTYFGGGGLGGKDIMRGHDSGPSAAWTSSTLATTAPAANVDDDEYPGVTTIRFPASSYTASSLEAILRYIYYNESRAGIDFVTALYCMNMHVTNYFGLREYVNGVSTTSSMVAHAPILAAANFSTDLEKSCISILHASLSASVASNHPNSPLSSSTLSPLAVDCLTLIQSAYQYGDHSLFSKASLFLDWTHLDFLMSQAMKTKQREEHAEKAQKLRQLQRKNERMKKRVHTSQASLLAATTNKLQLSQMLLFGITSTSTTATTGATSSTVSTNETKVDSGANLSPAASISTTATTNIPITSSTTSGDSQASDSSLSDDDDDELDVTEEEELDEDESRLVDGFLSIRSGPPSSIQFEFIRAIIAEKSRVMMKAARTTTVMTSTNQL